ncbi:MAG: hypothetical protein A2725_00085 [Candidatus Magasanikbacteria bacterium RIFCSPHIGHO2_01_FULL_33_34]|uniref:Uncharacterized protein n=1 Tax=Candidatus Magasanikbacteria bacterium RIFCSPHIGHO2_01_FULL_33_34 TaxID=1798671 RepID=A0A1F6LKZ6_9BACT|nr:MAG: hypothetical protein A2725_00085 [Candidatus Magasanikbacteria bacterium RIFCSPHIGHO2_01_FULL_33_34]OGH65759.1 MAG: hypothetical protein A3B83_02755 [Candidatus Magasanikbacteria bacterium RIFCSPHIGHO2_02_FULL_33_17]OGH75125.1 MAG: hypothetical protein A3A89_03350 [Candidatus Magasanikbacteria bacterium RIFCSPLOWO2_01_FULL_33_34]OGH81203.1 MAG: hypothetical protein A3F93_04050 [Candidatus Magasanikbacteria bacterium RIFCSPLOWO2_12_FULL_34_7]
MHDYGLTDEHIRCLMLASQSDRLWREMAIIVAVEGNLKDRESARVVTNNFTTGLGPKGRKARWYFLRSQYPFD